MISGGCHNTTLFNWSSKEGLQRYVQSTIRKQHNFRLSSSFFSFLSSKIDETSKADMRKNNEIWLGEVLQKLHILTCSQWGSNKKPVYQQQATALCVRKNNPKRLRKVVLHFCKPTTTNCPCFSSVVHYGARLLQNV